MSSRRHSHSRPHSHHPSHHGHASESGDIHQWLSSVGDRQPTVRAPSVASNAPSRAGSRVGNVLRSVLAHAGLPGPSRAGSRTPTVAGLAPSRAGSRAPTVVNRAPSGAGPPTLSSYHGTPPPSHHGSQPLHLAFDISTQAGSVLSGSARAPSTRAPSTRSQPISCHSLGTSRLAHASNSSTAPGPSYSTVFVPATTERQLRAWTRAGYEIAGPTTDIGTPMRYATDHVSGGPMPTGRRRGWRW